MESGKFGYIRFVSGVCPFRVINTGFMQRSTVAEVTSLSSNSLQCTNANSKHRKNKTLKQRNSSGKRN